MTREEAIYRLKNMAWLYGSVEREQNIEAIDMAIEALNEADKREQYGQNYEADDFVKLGVTDKNKDKVILYDAFGEKEYYPQTELVRCKDCIYYETCNLSSSHWWKGGYTVDIEFCSFGERRKP